jgi:hypothetical protein
LPDFAEKINNLQVVGKFVQFVTKENYFKAVKLRHVSVILIIALHVRHRAIALISRAFPKSQGFGTLNISPALVAYRMQALIAALSLNHCY